MVEKRLGSEDFNDEIIVYNLFSRKMPLVTFDKLLQKRCKDLEFRLLSFSFSWNLYHFKVELGFQFIDHISTSKFLQKVVSPFFNGTQWTGRDLNPRPPACKAGDLPLIYRPFRLNF